MPAGDMIKARQRTAPGHRSDKNQYGSLRSPLQARHGGRFRVTFVRMCRRRGRCLCICPSRWVLVGFELARCCSPVPQLRWPVAKEQTSIHQRLPPRVPSAADSPRGIRRHAAGRRPVDDAGEELRPHALQRARRDQHEQRRQARASRGPSRPASIAGRKRRRSSSATRCTSSRRSRTSSTRST